MKDSYALTTSKSCSSVKIPTKIRLRIAIVFGSIAACLTVVTHSYIWLLSWAAAYLFITFEHRLKPLILSFQGRVKTWQVALSIVIVAFMLSQSVAPSLAAGNFGFLDPVHQATSDAFTASGATNGAAMADTIFGFGIAFIAIMAIIGAGVGIFMHQHQGVPLLQAFGIAIGVAMFVGISSMLLKGIGLNG